MRRILLACIIAAAACAGEPKEKASAPTSSLPRLPYMGQPTPGATPEKFAPGVVNTDAIEINGVFTPDGREFFFTRLVEGVDTIYR